MKYILLQIFMLTSIFGFAQDQDNTLKKISSKSRSYIAEANQKVGNNFVEAEMDYRKAISVKPSSVEGNYNLAHSYYKKENYEEALFRNKQATQNATNKLQKHKAFHNIGNILMKNKKCKDAVEAFKNALRNNPKDDGTRYNLVLAQDCAKGQADEPQEEDKDSENDKDKNENKDEENKDNNDKKNDDKGGDKENKEDEDKEKDKKSDPKDDKKNEGDKGNQQPQPQPQPQGQLSPQQIKNLLEAMENEEQKVQDKVNAKKAKGTKIKTEKDW